jgi:putative aldouronate transport system substrate-binding protein
MDLTNVDDKLAGLTSHAATRRMGRRSFLLIMGATTVGATSLVNACLPTLSPPTPTVAATGAAATKPTAAAAAPAPAPTTAPPEVATAVLTKLKLPTYVPYTGGPKADLPATDDGVQAGYFAYPKNLVKSVAQPPGSGTTVTALTSLPFPAPPPVDQNPAWQAIHKELNAKIDMRMVPSDVYQTALATTMAGNDLPDLMYLPSIGATAADLPQFLKTACSDLTPYLSGDAIKDYPHLAAFPTASWLNGVFEGAIYAVPIVRPKINYVWFANQVWMNQIGAPKQPKNADEFKQTLLQFTRPQDNKWGMGIWAPDYGLQTGRGDDPMLAMFGVPNNWSVDANGKFTKDLETEQFKAAVAFVRDLYASGVFFPEKLPLNATPIKTALIGSKIGVMTTGWISYATQLWESGVKATPVMMPRTIDPFSHDGSKPIWHQFQGAIGITVVRKAAPERVKELLRILNYLAAPFGSQESLLLEYGVEGVDFNFDDQGTPVKTDKGSADVNVTWQYLAVRAPVLYDAAVPDFAKSAYEDAKPMIASLVADPTAGLYSATDRAKGGLLLQNLTDALGPIVSGEAPLSDLDTVIGTWRKNGGDQMRTEYEMANAAFHE